MAKNQKENCNLEKKTRKTFNSDRKRNFAESDLEALRLT